MLSCKYMRYMKVASSGVVVPAVGYRSVYMRHVPRHETYQKAFLRVYILVQQRDRPAATL